MKRAALFGACVAALAVAGTVRATNIISNGDFEDTAAWIDGDHGGFFSVTDKWTGQCWGGKDGWKLGTDGGHSGMNYAHQIDWGAGCYQIATAPAGVTAGDITLSLWSKPAPGDHWIDVYGMDTLPAVGTHWTNVDDGATQIGGFAPPDGSNGWAQLTETMTNVQPYAYYAVVVSGNNEIMFDDVTLDVPTAPVPEPASLSLLGLGALAMLRRRRA